MWSIVRYLDFPCLALSAAAPGLSMRSIRVIKADPCDRKAIFTNLGKTREEGSIKGIINLAMVLGDAPMGSMTGEAWDRALRVKIDSSWILHEETRQDPLDFFIVFSSIAGILGNRDQGNYNVANTFLNALAEYRQWCDEYVYYSSYFSSILTLVGGLADMGVLYDHSKPDML